MHFNKNSLSTTVVILFLQTKCFILFQADFELSKLKISQNYHVNKICVPHLYDETKVEEKPKISVRAHSD